MFGIIQKKGLNGIVKAASKIVGVKFRCLSHIYDEQVLKKASAIRGDSSHPLRHEYQLLPSAPVNGYRPLRLRTTGIIFHLSLLPSVPLMGEAGGGS